MIHYVFDGSFTGLLCCVFEAFEMNEKNIRIFWDKTYQPTAFDQNRVIYSDQEKAQRVWNGFIKRTDSIAKKRFYFAYLSENSQTFQHLFDIAVYVFQHKNNVAHNYGHPDVLAVAQMAKSVSREKHRMEAFIRFKKAADGLFYAIVNPDFNVLPLIQRHFKNRYADQPWLIYDKARKYGIYYDTETVEIVNLTFNPMTKNSDSNLPTLQINDEKEALYDQLWKDYFKSTNIVERKNTKLHLQHVPKRYWQYLNEKQ